MNLTITGHHLEVTPSLREYITAKLERIRRHFDQVVDTAVVLSVEKLQQRAEVTLHVRGKDLYAESVAPDLYAAIDTLIDKLDRQVLKYKETRQSRPHESVRHAPSA